MTSPQGLPAIDGRRRQEDRSRVMRQRLIDATLSCLETEGYAGTTISKIVSRAAVSRGAHVHHFPSKAALIEAAALTLVKQQYKQLGQNFTDLASQPDRLNYMVRETWRTLFNTREQGVLLELLVASRHDTELAAVVQRLWQTGYTLVQGAVNHYFEPLSSEQEMAALFLQLQWILRGMALDRHLLPSNKLVEQQLNLWCDLASSRLRPRQGVVTPPPRPPSWTDGKTQG